MESSTLAPYKRNDANMSIATQFKKHQESSAIASASEFIKLNSGMSLVDFLELSEVISNCGLDFKSFLFPIKNVKTELLNNRNDYSVSIEDTKSFIKDYIANNQNFECKEICSEFFKVYGSTMTDYELSKSKQGQQRYKSRIGKLIFTLKHSGEIEHKKVKGLYTATN